MSLADHLREHAILGVGNSRRVIEKSISYNAASPVLLVSKPTGWIVERVQIIVDDLWLSPDTSISVGTDSQPDRYFWSGLVDFNVYFRAGWEMSSEFFTPAKEDIYAYLGQAGATKGSVRIFVTLVKPEVV